MGRLANKITQAIYEILWKSNKREGLNYCHICYKIDWEPNLKYEYRMYNCYMNFICKNCYRKYKKCDATEIEMIARKYYNNQDVIEQEPSWILS